MSYNSLSEQKLQRGLRNVVRDGVMSNGMTVLTSGAFLAVLALHFGASNVVIGILATIPSIAQFVQIPAILLIEWLRKRKLITIIFSILSRAFLLLIAGIPFLFTTKGRLSFLILALILNAVFGSVSACSWNSWMRDLIPQEKLGSFFARRLSIAFSIGLPLSLLAGFGVDYWKRNFPADAITGYSLLFASGFLLGIIGVLFISRIPEPPMPFLQEKTRLMKLLLEPFYDLNYRNLFHFLGSWHFAVNLVAPFFTVYILKRLQFDLSWIIGFTILSQLMNVLFLRLWGRFADRFSNKSILQVSGPLFIICILAWTFTTIPERYMLTLPLLILIHLFMGIATAGVTLGTSNISMKLAPKGKATAYLGANSLIASVSASIGWAGLKKSVRWKRKW